MCFRYINDIFFIWTHGQEKLEGFLDNFNKSHLRFTHEDSRKNVILKQQIDTIISIKRRQIFTILNGRQFIAKFCELVGYVHLKIT